MGQRMCQFALDWYTDTRIPSSCLHFSNVNIAYHIAGALVRMYVGTYASAMRCEYYVNTAPLFIVLYYRYVNVLRNLFSVSVLQMNVFRSLSLTHSYSVSFALSLSLYLAFTVSHIVPFHFARTFLSCFNSVRNIDIVRGASWYVRYFEVFSRHFTAICIYTRASLIRNNNNKKWNKS